MIVLCLWMLLGKHPRDDLSGMDVARKALIIARLLGKRIDLDSIKVESLFPVEMGPNMMPVEAFLENGLPLLDKGIQERVEKASSNGNVLRYVCLIEDSRYEVGIQELPKNSPLGRLRGSDNVICIMSYLATSVGDLQRCPVLVIFVAVVATGICIFEIGDIKQVLQSTTIGHSRFRIIFGVTEVVLWTCLVANSGWFLITELIQKLLNGQRIPNEQVRKELGDIEALTDEKIDLILQSMSKAMLNAYTRVLAKKFPKMRINCVHPEYVSTDINFHTGTMSLEEGAKGPVMLALLPEGGPTSCYFDRTEMAKVLRSIYSQMGTMR
ncbi:glyceraldehyde-3-phosphate dehydrogenase-like family protein [Actinidia rufa]|uniref:homoserine dehydrogenase n=1 Tax=Actinidia rufa TaxID=165716 RepID=A0A7J0H4L6_9ERIC|nr:glyceraldehyde-3-phosphate dehydrogenase-like family protein [Actinidia rufa]